MRDGEQLALEDEIENIAALDTITIFFLYSGLFLPTKMSSHSSMVSIPLDWRSKEFSLEFPEFLHHHHIDPHTFQDTISHCNSISKSLTASIQKHRLYIAVVFTVSLIVFLLFAVVPLIGVIFEGLEIFLFLYCLLPFGIVIYIIAMLWSIYSVYRKTQDWKQEMHKQLNQILEQDNRSNYLRKGIELRYCILEQKQLDKYGTEYVIEVPSIEIVTLSSTLPPHNTTADANEHTEEGVSIER